MNVCELFLEKTRYAIILMKRREVITQLMMPLYGSKDAPRRMVSNRLTFISFKQFFISLRVRLCTPLFETKITKYECTCSEEIQKIRYHYNFS